MIGCLIEMTKDGRVKTVFILANSDMEQAVVEWGLARIASPRAWGWLSRLFRRGRQHAHG